jgi:hypothetical protein
MRMPRMTLRWCMTAVAVVGLLMGGIVGGFRLKRRHDSFLARARRYAQREALVRASEASTRGAYAGLCDAIIEMEEARGSKPEVGDAIGTIRHHAELTKESAERLSREAASWGSLARKYRHAVRYPWLRVEPDPTPPEP